MRSFVFVPALLLATGCSFAKDPYLFTSLADVPLVVVGDASLDAGLGDAPGSDDAADAEVDGGFGDPDLGVAPDDAAAPADSGPRYRAGNALQLGAIDQGLRGVGPNDLPSVGAARTLEAWVKAPRAPRSARLFGYGMSWSAFDLLLVTTSERSHMILFEGPNVVTSAVTPAFEDEAWHHVAVTVTASAAPDSTALVHFYVDGVFTSSTTVTSVNPSGQPAREVVIGGLPTDAIGFSSVQIDEVRLWSVVRSVEELARDRSQLIRTAPGLVGAWAMDALGRGAGIEIENVATSTSAQRAPTLTSVGDVELVESTVF